MLTKDRINTTTVSSSGTQVLGLILPRYAFEKRPFKQLIISGDATIRRDLRDCWTNDKKTTRDATETTR